MKNSIAKNFKNRINKASFEEKSFIAKEAKKAAKFDFGNLVTKLKFEDDSILEISTKFKAKLV